ncbi:MAG: DNA polymerase III subunit alpha [Erysipelotrichales bacterium]|nr:DNA polymerase III subunit alpha [Erysipelotrichales bacterium]
MVHLHVRSTYSLLKGVMSIETIINKAKENNVRALCLSDYHSMHAALNFYNACLKNDIKPLFGLEVKVLLKDNDYVYVNVIAKDNEGYEKLLALSSLLCTTHMNGVSVEEFKEYATNVVVILMNGGIYENSIIQENYDSIKPLLELFEGIEDCYLGLIHAESPLWRKRQPLMKEWASKHQMKCVALSRILYEQSGDESLLQVLEAIAGNKFISQMGSPKERNRYFKTNEEMISLYDKEDLDEAERIADSCTVTIKQSGIRLPKFPLQVDADSKTYLRELCYLGLKKRLNNKLTPEYTSRLDHELKIIFDMHFEDYFLIVWDFVRYSKSKGILTGAGRGSAAGSLVAYCLGIIHVDPIKYDLLFERFLNPERISMPDIDMDFMDTRREEVIAYVSEKYGNDHVAHITTFNTLKAKQVLRDVGRVLEIPTYEIDILTKKIPYAPAIKLMDVYRDNASFKQAVNSKKHLQKLFSIALKLEGLPRHVSVHAAGIVIADEELMKSVPVIRLDDGNYATQYPAENLESLGLIKMDFLGLRNLTIIDDVLRDVEKAYNKRVDIMRLDLNDAKTIALFTNVETIGVFQFESEGMKNFLRKLRIRNFDEVVAAVALFRPGPMENIPEYIRRRETNEFVSIHPRLDHIVKSTYGILIYQEQIMQLAQEMAGFSLGKADLLRRAMSKKKEKDLIVLKDDFTKGALAQGFDSEIIEEVYALIMKFANYGFNKSHSVAYGLIAYQMAYLKANYPLAFFKALLNSVIGSEAKTYEYMEEAKKIGIKFLPFDINYSSATYEIQDDGLRPPLSMIKNVGGIATSEILKERELRGEYKDYFDLVARSNTKRVNRKVLESLIDAGALDCFSYTRNSMSKHLDDAIQYGELVRIEDSDQVRFSFDIVSKPYIKPIEDRFDVRLEREREVLGFYYSNHPIVEIKKSMNLTTSINNIHNSKGTVSFIGIVNSKREYRTKNGTFMAFMNVRDETGEVDVTVFPNVYKDHSDIKRNDYVKIEGRNDDRGAVVVNKIAKLDIMLLMERGELHNGKE